MKTYFDYIDEITANELYDGLLGYGLFSDMIPPFLCSDSFLKYCKKNKKVFEQKCDPAQYIEYSSMRNIGIPRIIGIPSPIHYHQLCQKLSENWDKIKIHFLNQTYMDKYKRSRIHIKKMKRTKAIFKMNYNNWRNDENPEIDILKDNRFIVHADISNCFGSIYTHAISWALMGKDVAKSNTKNTHLWYNELDYVTRNCKFGETNGILIGPHSSNVLSEIILTAIDNNLRKKWEYIRNIDDYTCFVKSKEQAMQFLIDLNDELRKYNLTLNHRKTTIKELPLALTEGWIHRFDNLLMLYRRNGFNYKSIKSYLDNAVELMVANDNNAAILNYAIKCISDNVLSLNAKKYYVKYVLHLCLLYPYLLRIIDEYVFEKFKIDKETFSEFLKNVLKNSEKNHNFDGICYSIYFAIKYNIEIKIEDYVSFLIDKEDCIGCLLAYLYCKKNGCKTEENKLYQYAIKLNSRDEDFYKNWVFVYEVLSRKDLRENTWKGLKKSSVSFISNRFKLFIKKSHTKSVI